jgi:hypothetical protein
LWEIILYREVTKITTEPLKEYLVYMRLSLFEVLGTHVTVHCYRRQAATKRPSGTLTDTADRSVWRPVMATSVILLPVQIRRKAFEDSPNPSG